VAELPDAHGLGQCPERGRGWNPLSRTELHAEVRGGSGHSGVKKRPEWNQNKSSLLRSPIAADQ